MIIFYLFVQAQVLAVAKSSFTTMYAYNGHTAIDDESISHSSLSDTNTNAFAVN
jgi:hypothetical protein